MKYIRPSELIQSEEFIREPVHTTLKEIESLPTSKIILRGGGTGRSTVLAYMQERKANTSNPFIKMNFESSGISINASDIFSEEFFEHYWEIEFAKRLLWYIEKYYELTYYTDFEKYSKFIKQSSKETIDFINKSFYTENQSLPKLYSQNEIVEEIIEKFKKQMKIESFWLGVDYFDCIDNSKPLTQKIISSYFLLFDKVIIVAKDESLPEEWYKTYFKEDSVLYTYLPYTIEYSKDIDTIKNIIIKRINKYNFSLNESNKTNYNSLKPFPLEWLNYDVLRLLVTKTNGNIRMMLDIVDELIMEWNFTDSIFKLDLEEIIAQEEKKGMTRKLQRVQPKLHL